MTETLSSRGASVRMIRLYSGTYLSVSGLARAMPLSISGTNCRGSLTNFFTPLPPGRLGLGRALRPQLGKCLEHHGDGHGARVQRADAALPGIAGPPTHGLHGPCRLGPLARGDRRRPQDRGRVVPHADLLLDRVDRGDERVEQRLVADVGVPARLDTLDGGPQQGDDLRWLQLDGGPGGRARPQERRAPDRARGAADTAGDDDGDLLEERADVRAVEAVPVLEHQLEAASHRVAEIAVADHRVQVAELLLVVYCDLRDRAHDDLHVDETCCGHGRSLVRGHRRKAGGRLWTVTAGQDAGQGRQGDPAARRGPAAVGEPLRVLALRVTEGGEDQRCFAEVLDRKSVV